MASAPPSTPITTTADSVSTPTTTSSQNSSSNSVSAPTTTSSQNSSTLDSSYSLPPNVFTDPMFVSVFVICVAAVMGIVYYASLGNGSDNLSSFDTTSTSGAPSQVGSGTYFFLTIAIICASFYAVYYILEKYYGYDITSKFFSGTTQTGPEFDIDFNQDIDPEPTPPPPPPPTDQVFNIPDNVFDYTNADAVCKAFGSELATYEQIENAYQNGAEWGNYGWSAGQMAFFPTQKETYDTLQKIPGHEHDRGRTGINGGYIANPNVRFGANCYGQKPVMTTEDEERMMNTLPYPQTKEDIELDNKVAEWSGRLDEIVVSPFNENKWSEY